MVDGIKPQIIIEDPTSIGQHNKNLENSMDRLIKGHTYEDLSTICIVPVVGANVVGDNGKTIRVPLIHARIVQNWMGILPPMNQKFIRIFMMDMRVDEAYTKAIELILNNPELSKWKYIFTLEQDNMPPADCLMKLYESINTPPEKGGPYDVVGALYWTKGQTGQPMIYGNPNAAPLNFIPQVPMPDTVQRCNGLGMGCNLFRLSVFKDLKLRKPWFKTQQEVIPGQGVKCYTQDLWFYEDAGKNGYKFACDTRIKCGHYSMEEDIVW